MNSETIEKTRRLSDLDPLTRSVVATFAWDKPIMDYMSAPAYIESIEEAFPSLNEEDVVKTIGWSGQQGMQNTVINRLCEEGRRDEVVAMTRELGRLAGNTRGTIALAHQVSHDIYLSARRFDTIPALQILSELALRSLSPETA